MKKEKNKRNLCESVNKNSSWCTFDRYLSTVCPFGVLTIKGILTLLKEFNALLLAKYFTYVICLLSAMRTVCYTLACSVLKYTEFSDLIFLFKIIHGLVHCKLHDSLLFSNSVRVGANTKGHKYQLFGTRSHKLVLSNFFINRVLSIKILEWRTIIMF